MRLFVFSLFVFVSLGAFAQRDSILAAAQRDSMLYLDTIPTYGAVVDKGLLSGYDRRVHYRRKYWGELIPTQFIIQNAGNMGLDGNTASTSSGRQTCCLAICHATKADVPNLR